MKKWFNISEQLSLKSKDNFQEEILFRLKEKIGTDFFPTKGKRFGSHQTQLIKYQLVDLGLDKGYWVYANRLNACQGEFDEKQKGKANVFKNREWLYDIHWYKDSLSKHYTTVEYVLVVECEWLTNRVDDTSGKSFSAVKYDFQKLLVSNANLKLLIFKAKNITEKDFIELDKYFQDAIDSYPNLEEGAKFLFICFAGQTFFYCEKFRVDK